jgi:uncharacterized membrane protein YgcG
VVNVKSWISGYSVGCLELVLFALADAASVPHGMLWNRIRMAPELRNSSAQYASSRVGVEFVSATAGVRISRSGRLRQYGAVFGAVAVVTAGGAWLQHHSAMSASAADATPSRAAAHRPPGRGVVSPLSGQLGQPLVGPGVDQGVPAAPSVATNSGPVGGFSTGGSAPQVAGPAPDGVAGSLVGASSLGHPSRSTPAGGNEGAGESSGEAGAVGGHGNGGGGGSHGGGGGGGSLWGSIIRFPPWPGGSQP